MWELYLLLKCIVSQLMFHSIKLIYYVSMSFMLSTEHNTMVRLLFMLSMDLNIWWRTLGLNKSVGIPNDISALLFAFLITYYYMKLFALL